MKTQDLFEGLKGALASSAVAVAIFGTATSALALPVLRETRSDYSGHLATIYPDHHDPNLFYFMPDSSAFAKNTDGSPVATLIHWGLSTKADLTDGGGMLNFVLKAAMTPELDAEIKAFQGKYPSARVTVIPLGASFIAIGNSKTGAPESWNKLITTADIPPYAGVAETEVGVNMLLTEIGAKVFKASIEKNPDYNIQLCYKVDGVTPFMQAIIELDYNKVYQHFQGSVSGGYLWWQATIATEVEKLYKNGDIKITIVGGDAKTEDIIMEIARDLMKTWFVESLSNQPGTGAPAGLAPGRFISFSFNSTYKEERSHVRFELKRSVLLTDDRCVNLSLKGLSPWANKIISDAD